MLYGDQTLSLSFSDLTEIRFSHPSIQSTAKVVQNSYQGDHPNHPHYFCDRLYGRRRGRKARPRDVFNDPGTGLWQSIHPLVSNILLEYFLALHAFIGDILVHNLTPNAESPVDFESSMSILKCIRVRKSSRN